MRFVIEGKLYDTETAKVVHEHTMYGEDGVFTQTLWETPHGKFFYVNEFPRGGSEAHAFDEPTNVYRSFAQGYGLERREVDDIDCAIKWLERHNGGEVILNRWPGRIEIA